ncbi:MAG: mitochondrial fission protein ELM1 [Planctomycetota bacterium]
MRGAFLKKSEVHNPTKQPLVWLLLGDKLGDNAQVAQVMDHLHWDHEVRRLVFLEEYRLGKPDFRPALYHVDIERSDDLCEPWPDILITVGRRPDMVAQWIRQQSGGKTRIVLFGRPKKDLGDYALIIVPSQYQLPKADHILPIKLPLMRVNQGRLAAGKKEWQERFGSMPHPITALLVGGPTKPFEMTTSSTEELARQALELSEKSRGSLFISTSRRTPAKVVAAISAAVGEKAELHVFDPAQAENPYMGLLAWGDRFIVTGDSVSMMVEVASLGKPLAIHELPLKAGVLNHLGQAAAKLLYREGAPLRFVGNMLQRFGWVGFPRDLTAIHRQLYQCGAATPLGRGFPEDSAMIASEVAVVAERIRSLAAQ